MLKHRNYISLLKTILRADRQALKAAKENTVRTMGHLGGQPSMI